MAFSPCQHRLAVPANSARRRQAGRAATLAVGQHVVRADEFIPVQK